MPVNVRPLERSKSKLNIKNKVRRKNSVIESGIGNIIFYISKMS